MIKLHCKDCGKQLDKKEILNGYDRITGEKLISIFYTCPNALGTNDVLHDSIEENSQEIQEIIRLGNLAQKAKEYKEKQVKVKTLVKDIENLGYKVKIEEIYD